jgi:hypothetical protein
MTQSPSTQIHHNVVPLEVGWQFVPQYYHFINKQPNRLHCFYTKTSTFIHGTEGEEGKPCYGQQEIHNRITAIGFQDCKVFIHSVDAQSSANGGIIIQAIGEMSNAGEPWRKFVQTFFLAEQPNGYFVLNDIFRFLKEETVEDDTSEADASVPAAESAPVPSVSVPVPAPEPAHEPEPERAPSPAPAPPAEEPAPTPPSPSPSPEPELVHTNGNGNGIHTTVEDEPAEPSPAPSPARSPSPSPTPTPAVTLPTPAAASPAPSTPAPSTTSIPSLPATSAPAAAPSAPPPQQVVQQSSAPPIPPTPKTWANLAATNSKKWGATAAESRGTTEVPASASVPSTPSGGQTPTTPYGPNANRGPPNTAGPHNAQQARSAAELASITTAQCFIKGVTEPVSQPALTGFLTQRFGPIKELEIVRSKACAFLEFTTIEGARRAIGASIQQSGVRIEVEGGQQVRILIETRKERGDRPVGRGRGGPPGGGDRGGYRGRAAPGGGRGRGVQGQGPAPAPPK